MDTLFGEIEAQCLAPYGNPVSFESDVDQL